MDTGLAADGVRILGAGAIVVHARLVLNDPGRHRGPSIRSATGQTREETTTRERRESRALVVARSTQNRVARRHRTSKIRLTGCTNRRQYLAKPDRDVTRANRPSAKRLPRGVRHATPAIGAPPPRLLRKEDVWQLLVFFACLRRS